MAINLIEKTRDRLARERGGVNIDRAAAVRFALVFPNVYSVGMASLGYQLVYRMLNELPDASCERVFLPDNDDLQEHQRTGTQLFTMESQSMLSEFNVLAFSVSFELDYLNILRILRLANLPLRSEERDETRPLVIAGGPCATFNPEPLADFIDAFVVGDAEEVLPEIVEVVKEHYGEAREDVLVALAGVDGVYIPRFYQPVYDEYGELVEYERQSPTPEKVRRAVASDLNQYPSGSVIHTPEAEFGDIELVEVTRGCGRHCRFCVAGYMTRPPRPRPLHDISSANRLGLVGAAVFDNPEVRDLCGNVVSGGGEFTVSSVRLETVTPEMAKLMAAGGQRTLTIAPEAGSDRLRRVINKISTEEQMISAVRAALDAGISRVKLYFMIGLPGENDEDIDAIIRLVQMLASEFPKISFQVSASSFVPKPWTPFQWHSMADEKILKRRFNALQKGIGVIKNARFGGESPRLAVIQGYLARGDRRVGELLLAALEKNGDFAAAVRETGFDTEQYICKTRGKDEVLPWDVIDMRVKKDYLWREYQKALGEETTEACNVGKCKACGACVDADEIS